MNDISWNKILLVLSSFAAFACTSKELVDSGQDLEQDETSTDAALNPPLPEEISFNEHIRPIFNANCTSCHGGVRKAGDLSLIYRHLALGEAKSGHRAVVPGDLENSHLLERIQAEDVDDLMPPPNHGPRLKPREVALIKRWIEEGASWQVHWAFEAPAALSDEWQGKADSPIDYLIEEKWKEHDLTKSSPASPAELLRRLSFDLTGLPPTPEDIDDFEQAYAKAGQQAVEAEVDRLLASPHYGERWASVWMDLARYADSEGLGADRRWTVWPYRDWLIRAFDEDMPFDEFTKQQLAGDLLENSGVDSQLATTFHRLTQSNNEGGTDDEEFRVNAVMDRVNTTWEAWQGQTFACVQCHAHPYDTFEHEEYYEFYAFFNQTQDSDASNHYPTLSVPRSHKNYEDADRVLMESNQLLEAMLGVGDNLRSDAVWQPLSGSSLSTKGTAANIVKQADGEEIHADDTVKKSTVYKLKWEPKSKKLEALLLEVFPKDEAKAAVFGENGFILGSAKLHRISPVGQRTAIPLSRILPDRQPALGDWNASLNPKSKSGWGAYAKLYKQRAAILTPAEPIELSEGEQLELTFGFPQIYLSSFALVPSKWKISESEGDVWKKALTEYDALFERYSQSQVTLSKLGKQKVPVMRQIAEGAQRPTSMFIRGNWLDHGTEITKAGVPASLPVIDSEDPSRLDLANWLVDGRNPLTARVAVNRIWQQLFGRGIVETLEDFGSSGIPPTHPKLLDYLALQFQETYGWSQKKLLREIVLSSTYQLSALALEGSRAKDPSNRYYSYGSRRRLRGEAVRDMSLSAAGLRSEKKFGPPVFPPLPPGVWKPFTKSDKWKTPERGHEDRYRRALYTYWKRSIPYPSLVAFDTPTREVCSKRRLVSNTPIAALTTLNDPAFEEFTQALAQRLLNLPNQDKKFQIAYGYRLTTSRLPSEETLDDLLELYEQNVKGDAESTDAHLIAMSLVTSVLLNLDLALTK